MNNPDERSFKSSALLAAKGAAIGAANTVPGVSGGTIAVLVGIYDRLVASVSRLASKDWKASFLYLLPVGTGVLVGIAVIAGALDYALVVFPEQTAFLFVGLILGSLPFVIRQAQPRGAAAPSPVHLGLFAACVALLVLQSRFGESGLTEPITMVTWTNVWLLFAAGVIAAATMVVPGVSGSFVLVILGLYSTFLNAVRTLNVPVLIVLIAGAGIGIVAISKAISWLLARYHHGTYWAISGLVVGSVAAIWPGISGPLAAVGDLAAAIAGTAAAMLLGKRRDDIPD